IEISRASIEYHAKIHNTERHLLLEADINAFSSHKDTRLFSRPQLQPSRSASEPSLVQNDASFDECGHDAFAILQPLAFAGIFSSRIPE
ncbi:hypothetical protein E4U47_000804, partial [Claviceps purpurea]